MRALSGEHDWTRTIALTLRNLKVKNWADLSFGARNVSVDAYDLATLRVA